MNLFNKHNMRLAGLALALWAMPRAVHAATPDKSASLFPNPVVATGKGFEIKNSELDDAFMNYSATLAASGGAIADDQRAEVRSNLLQHLILTKLLTQRATADDRMQATKLVDENIDEARKAAPSPEAFDQELKASGMTLEQVRARAFEEQLCRRVLERETTNGVVISDDAAKKFFDDYPSKFEVPEEVRVSHILVSTLDPVTQHPLAADQKKAKEQLAKEIRARAVKGEDFGKLVKQYSDDPGSKNKGGEYKFPRGQMVPEFEAAAFTLAVNQISEPVETQFGYHIIKLLEKYPAKHEAFADVKDRIKVYLTDKQAEKKLPAYLDKLKADADVKLIDPATGKALPVAPSASIPGVGPVPSGQ